MAPAWGLFPLVILATCATVIASQAVISGAFSLTQQAVQLGLLPRLEIQHTSESQVGQIYMPRVNWMLLAAVLGLVFVFGSSSALASAYGIAVTGTMVVTSLLAFTVFRRAWRWPLALALAVLVPLLSIEVIFLGANLAKFLDGGYVPLLLAAVVGILMTTWVRGTAIVQRKAHAGSVTLEQLIAMLKKSTPARAPGTAVFLTSDPDVAPSALLHNLKHNHVLHEPQRHRHRHRLHHAAGARRASGWRSSRSADTFWRIRLTFGYMEVPNVPRALALARKDGPDARDDEHLLLPQPPLVPPLAGIRHAALAGQALHRDDQGRLRRQRLLPPALEPRPRARPAVRGLERYGARRSRFGIPVLGLI